MRVGPLSDPRVARLLNRHFVPVYVSNEDYAEGGSASDEEKAERLRIFREGHQAGLSVGTVHAYILTSEGRTVDSLHVADAARTGRLLDMLERNVRSLGAPDGEPVVDPVRQSEPPECGPDELLLHLTARVVSGGAWDGIPGENWIRLDAAAKSGLLPGEAPLGATWDVEPESAARMLVHFYPATENNDLDKNEIERQSLRGTVISVDNGVVRARLDGALRMKHDFYHREDGLLVEAALVGWLEFEPAIGRIRTFRLVTDRATYNGGTFGIALQGPHQTGEGFAADPLQRDR